MPRLPSALPQPHRAASRSRCGSRARARRRCASGWPSNRATRASRSPSPPATRPARWPRPSPRPRRSRARPETRVSSSSQGCRARRAQPASSSATTHPKRGWHIACVVLRTRPRPRTDHEHPSRHPRRRFGRLCRSGHDRPGGRGLHRSRDRPERRRADRCRPPLAVAGLPLAAGAVLAHAEPRERRRPVRRSWQLALVRAGQARSPGARRRAGDQPRRWHLDRRQRRWLHRRAAWRGDGGRGRGRLDPRPPDQRQAQCRAHARAGRAARPGVAPARLGSDPARLDQVRHRPTPPPDLPSSILPWEVGWGRGPVPHPRQWIMSKYIYLNSNLPAPAATNCRSDP
ncbi:hypothetical protein NOVOSPHI9U_420273 [Novosphingobium sp. 9U]|nr:hypothetical protein NOVOSPHI9U_420273 [Novosphingobium sp. 9U]